MTFNEYFEKVINSNRADWHVTYCWGANSGPSFRDQFSQWGSGDDDRGWITVQSYPLLASFKPDLMMSMAFGFTYLEDFKEPWANQFPDPSASGCFMDFFYGSTLVHRERYVNVDGGRGILPLPKLVFNEKHELTGRTVTRPQVRFFRMFNTFEADLDFARYFEGAGFRVIDGEWPETRD